MTVLQLGVLFAVEDHKHRLFPARVLDRRRWTAPPPRPGADPHGGWDWQVARRGVRRDAQVGAAQRAAAPGTDWLCLRPLNRSSLVSTWEGYPELLPRRRDDAARAHADHERQLRDWKVVNIRLQALGLDQVTPDTDGRAAALTLDQVQHLLHRAEAGVTASEAPR